MRERNACAGALPNNPPLIFSPSIYCLLSFLDEFECEKKFRRDFIRFWIIFREF